jgi:hypothetical protein
MNLTTRCSSLVLVSLCVAAAQPASAVTSTTAKENCEHLKGREYVNCFAREYDRKDAGAPNQAATTQSIQTEVAQAAIAVVRSERKAMQATCGHDGVRCKDFRVTGSQVLPITAADRANGALAKAKARVEFIIQLPTSPWKGAPMGPWQDGCELVCIGKGSDGVWRLRETDDRCQFVPLAQWHC